MSQRKITPRVDLTRFLEFDDRFLAGIKGGVIRPVFSPDGARVCFAEPGPDTTVIWEVDPRQRTRSHLVDPDRLRDALQDQLGRTIVFTDFAFVGKRNIRVIDPATGSPVVDIDLDTYRVTRVNDVEVDRHLRAIPRPARKGSFPWSYGVSEIPSPDGTLLLGEQGPDLAVRSVVDDKQHVLTTDGVPGHAWQVDGALWWAPGAAWSHDGGRLAVVRKDFRGCAELPLVSWLQTNELVDLRPYARAGGALPSIRAALIDVTSRRRQEVAVPGEPDQVIIPVGWRHDGAAAYLLTMDRRRKYMRLYAADAVTGALRMICEETQPTFIVGIRGFEGRAVPTIGPRQIDRFSAKMILADDKRLLWFSERDGWRHLYLYGTDGALIGQLTRGQFEVVEVLDVDLAANVVYFSAHCNLARPYDIHVCRVGLDGGELRQLTTLPGVHEAVAAPTKTYFVDTHSALDRPVSTDVLPVDGHAAMTISVADVSRLEQLDLPQREPFTVTASDGVTELHGVLYLPPGFDPARSYPVIEYQYGGPQTIAHPTTFTGALGYWGMAMALAREGFVVFTVDGRGTPGRGKAFQDIAYGRFHEYFVEDHAHVVSELLKRYTYMDKARVGIVGASWGGYSTVRSMLLAPELYKVGVAICPVYDLYDQNAYALEPYMGLPVDRPEAFAAGSSLAIANRLEGKLLMIQGTADVNATFSATMKMCEALARANKPYDLVILPEADHTFTAGGMHQQRYMRAATIRYFAEHLGGGVSPIT